MATNGWQHADLVRISGESSSVVSQWLGKTDKPTKSIGRVRTALRLGEASGYCAEWIADGTGPKKPPPRLVRPQLASEPAAAYTFSDCLQDLAAALEALPAAHREAAATNLAGLARDGGAEHWMRALRPLLTLNAPSGKRAATD
jgi:hypothetical protein